MASAPDEVVIATGAPKSDDKGVKDLPQGFVLLHNDEAKPTTCCGKCCNPRAAMRPESTPDKAIFPVKPFKACSVGRFMEEKDIHRPPAALRDLGLTTDLWSRFMEKLGPEVQSKQYSTCGAISCCIATFGVSCCLGKCPNNKNYQLALKNWQEEFNVELAKVEMQCKTQTHVHGWMQYTPNGQYGGSVQRHEVTSSWLAVAHGQAAMAQLGAAKHITETGVPRPKGKCCSWQATDAETVI